LTSFKGLGWCTSRIAIHLARLCSRTIMGYQGGGAILDVS
jgi:hypothetical protein